MSGGHWEYKNDYLSHEIFGWGLYPDYGEDGFEQSAIARKKNPLEDKLMSEMLWDMLCVLHSYDWYASGDTCEETYRKDVARFKKKWLKFSEGELVRREIDAELEETRKELYRSLGVSVEEEK
jgi:hypothetical protein